MTARLATAALLAIACLIAWSAATARYESTRLIGLVLAAGLIVVDILFAVVWLEAHGGAW